MSTSTEPTEAPVIEGTLAETTSVQLAHPPAVIPPTPPILAVVPQVQAEELVQRLAVIQNAASTAMTENVDYGKIPGTDKPTLLKPGAEKLGVLFQLDVQLVNEKMWGPGDHLTVLSRATVFHAPTGARLGFGEGLCTTREKKYAKRRGELLCPECGKANIRRSKRDPEFYCWQKTDGCGAKFPLTDARITGQDVGDVENPDLPDSWNTIVKMAEKRARVDAVLAVTGASAIFTQDVEDQPHAATAESQERAQEPEPELLTDESVAEVLTAIKHAAKGTEWVRSQLVAIGAQHVPEGALTKGTIQRLTPEQAVELVQVCESVAEKAAQG